MHRPKTITFVSLEGMHKIELSSVHLIAESQYNINIQGEINIFTSILLASLLISYIRLRSAVIVNVNVA